MQLRRSAEDYLKAILILSEENPQLRAIDVSRHLGYSKPSVSRALASLKTEGLLDIGPEGVLALTESGLAAAVEVRHRHQLLRRFFITIGVPKALADEDACKVEHALSPETFACIQALQETLPAPKKKSGDKDKKKKKKKSKKN